MESGDLALATFVFLLTSMLFHEGSMWESVGSTAHKSLNLEGFHCDKVVDGGWQLPSQAFSNALGIVVPEF